MLVKTCGSKFNFFPVCKTVSVSFIKAIRGSGVKHLKHQILTLDVKIWCWTSIWRFLTSSINFWRPKSNIWRPTSIFDVLRQIWHQYLTSNIKYLTSNIKYLMFSIKYWCWTSNIDAKFDVGRQKLMLDVKYWWDCHGRKPCVIQQWKMKGSKFFLGSKYSREQYQE